ncbi:mediator of RNA polymerase II transcription subunit 25-like isoform X2 [Lotus japonicus]|uniref:mediator of RNA polymerase II transcription subunit 25-like isoform X2 n=1 Tax=Lotus japonicus TaxID=34305 RepID=UPI0025825DE6|nr:mediator of RNA polymerase II transcription subunit 25-like isoform X2 [Lotus japonicus]
MVTKKWLSIVVDGNAALRPHWPHIVSEYLEKIVRRFLINCDEEGAYLGLLHYNTNFDAGYTVRFVEWTKDVNRFLQALSSLSFNGNSQDQYTMADGLAEALMMFLKPFNYIMTKEEYNSAERHCLLVTAGDPIPRRMLVSMPSIREGQVVGPHEKDCMADFLEVAKMFVQLSVSLSVITPNESLIFRAIFNKGNNVSSMENSSIPNYGINQYIVLLSRNFQEAHVALHENLMVTLPAQREGQSSAHQVTMGDQITEDPNALRNESPLVFPNATNYMHASSPSFEYPMNHFDDIVPDLGAENDFLRASKKPKTFTALEDGIPENLFHQDELNSTVINNSVREEQRMHTEKNVPVEAIETVETELEPTLRVVSQNISNNQTSNMDLTANSEVNMSGQVVANAEPTFTTEQGSSTRLLQTLTPRRDKNTKNHVISSKNYSTSAFSVPQYPSSPSPSWTDQGPMQQACHPQLGMTSISSRLGIVDQDDPRQFHYDASFGSSMIPSAVENSPMQFQPNSAPVVPVLHDATSQYVRGPMGNFSGKPTEHVTMTSYGPLNTPPMGPTTSVPPMPGMAPTIYPGQLLPPPSLSDLQDYVQTWEGSLAAKFQPNHVSLIKAQAFSKATPPFSLTLQWSSRLEISNFLPEKAVNYTKCSLSRPVYYVFLNTLSKSNKLYEHLLSKKLCAKIDFSHQSLILSPTEKKYFFLGSVFPRGTTFVEPR